MDTIKKPPAKKAKARPQTQPCGVPIAPRRRRRIGDRYVDLGPLGEGSQAIVRRALDERLNRPVALKILRSSDAAEQVARFGLEGSLTARLSHPGIVAVHDRGVLESGRPWFAMAIVQGRTLGDLLWDRQIDTRRGLRLLIRVAEAVHYAHGEGVVHLDLKPDNIIIDRHDNPYVLDWGIAHSEGHTPDQLPAYQAPEVLGGATPTPAADIYALGHLLLEVLAGQAQQNDPEPLQRLADAAISPDPADRPADALTLATRLQDWLDGIPSRQKARALRAEARAHQAAREVAQMHALDKRRQLAELATGPTSGGQREIRWRLEDEALALDHQALEARAHTVRCLHAALSHAPHHRETRLALAHWYRSAAAEAAAQNDNAAEAVARGFVEAHDIDGEHADWLAGRATVTLSTRPTASQIWAHPIALKGRRMQRLPGRLLSSPLSHGAWSLRIVCADRPEVELPIHLDRGGRLDRRRPGSTTDVPLVVPKRSPAGCRFVADGWAAVGGDPRAPDPMSLRKVWIDAFFMGTQPVTVGEYAQFLEALQAAGEPCEAHLPQHSDDPSWIPIRLEGGRIVFDTAIERHPITLVSWHDASAYAHWRRSVDGLPWRLPTSLEWEKAARGVDGRSWPWGNHHELDWARMYPSPDTPGPTTVDAYPFDVSVYGVRGMAGNTRDWCADGYQRTGPAPDSVPKLVVGHAASLRVIRGGCWASAPDMCRLAGRFAAQPDARFISTGFRLACSFPLERLETKPANAPEA